jgi:hypothetical protein
LNWGTKRIEIEDKAMIDHTFGRSDHGPTPFRPKKRKNEGLSFDRIGAQTENERQMIDHIFEGFRSI